MITMTQHEQVEFGRCAQAMYQRGQNLLGHQMSAVASSTVVSQARYDGAAFAYRRWLVFDEPKDA
jgi:hypothetical protein